MRARRVIPPLASIGASLAVLLSVPAVPASAAVTVTSHFIYTAPGNGTFVDPINNDATNGQGNALLFVTPNPTPGGECGCVGDTVPVGVIYNVFGGQLWAIANLDESTTIAAGTTYNVLVVEKSSKDVFVQTATSANTLGGATYINSPLTNDKPDAQVLVTANIDPGGANGFVSDHPVGAYYNSTLKKWGVLNEDGASMAVGAHFNVMVGSKASNGGKEAVVQATGGNTSGSRTLISMKNANGNPNAAVFATQNSDPGGKVAGFDTSATGVEYVPGPTDQWAVFQEDGSSMTVGTAFNVMVYPG